MELRQLRHIVALAEEMHFARAAQRLCLTQPALSSSLMRLERDLGVRLFERSRKEVRLTPAGEAMVGRAREIVSLADKAKALARSIAAGRAGRIDIGFTGTLLYRGLDEVLTRFSSAHPDVELTMRETGSARQIELVRTGHLDAGFVSAPLPPADLSSAVLAIEALMACLPAAHPLATNDEIELSSLRDERFVMLAREASPAYHDQMIALCAAAGFEPKVALEPTQVLSAVALVGLGYGVSLVPGSLRRIGIRGVAYVRLKGIDALPNAYLVWNPQRPCPGLAELIATVRRLPAA